INFKIAEDSASGIYNNYFLDIFEKKSKRIVTFSCFLGDNDENSLLYLNIGDKIKENLQKYNISNYELSENGVTVLTTAPISTLREMLDCLIDIFVENSVPNSSFCSFCGAKFADGVKRKIVAIDDKKNLICDKCTLEVVEESENKKNQPIDKKSDSKLFSGIIGAIIGAIIASLLYIGLFFVLPANSSFKLLQYFICLVGFAIGLFAFYGYKLCAKTTTKATIYVTSFTSLFFVAVSHYLGCVIYGVAKYGTFEKFKFIPKTFFKIPFTDSTISVYLWAGLVLALCSAAAAVLIFAVSAYKNKIEKAESKISIQSIK
ncbi:MAG: zinc ribbon domain-containing protein, partial [Clostridia bacterium]